MNTDQLAWAFRTIMVVGAAVVAYLLVQDTVALSPIVQVILGAIAVGLAALNPVSLANRVTPS